jgi:hypothetical protein
VVEDRDEVVACVEGEKERDGAVLHVVENGPISFVGPLEGECVWGQRKGKEVVIWEDNNNKKILNGSTSVWALHSVGLGQTITNNENYEVRVLKDKEVALLAENENENHQIECGKKTKEGGGRKLPLFFGPNKWANLSKAHKLNAGKKKKQKKHKGKGGKKRKTASLVTEDNYEDEIHSENSESMGDSSSGVARQHIPVSSIQIVLNEGEVNRRGDVDVRGIRLEAERLFHIGLNLGITSNEERLGTLDRMVDLEINDVMNFEADGGEEEVR